MRPVLTGVLDYYAFCLCQKKSPNWLINFTFDYSIIRDIISVKQIDFTAFEYRITK